MYVCKRIFVLILFSLIITQYKDENQEKESDDLPYRLDRLKYDLVGVAVKFQNNSLII